MEATMNNSFPEISDESIARLTREMNEVGYSSLIGYLSEEQLGSAQEYVSSEMKKNKDQYFMHTGLDRISGTVLHSLATSPQLKSAFERMLKKIGRDQDSMENPYIGVRCIKGQTGLNKSYQFHFDAYIITMLAPVVIPTEGEKTGDLLMYPNLRNIRSSSVVNLAEKFLYQSRFSITILREMIKRRILKPKILKLVPGNIYFFWGYRSLHANEPCATDALRATAIFHFGQPHKNSSIVKLIEKRIQQRNQQRARLTGA
jgi:hypothetical protein